jgi:DNA-binding LacI/PurR family transcriptional regulator
MTTIKDIARVAGVSVGTVSNYMNNPDLLNNDTRNKIHQTIEKLNYNPSAAARSLVMNRTMRIGLVHLISTHSNYQQEMNDSAFLELLAAINTTAAENGYSLLLSAATSKSQELSIIKKLVGEKQVDGLIFMATQEDDERINFLCQKDFPFASFGRSKGCEKFSFVDVDGEKGIVQVVNYLIDLGHHRIAYLNPPDGLMFAKHRWKGFCNAMMEHAIPIQEELIVDSGFNEVSGHKAILQLLELSQPPSAVIAPNDISAFGVMKGLQERGFMPGKDVSVVGFDDISLANLWHPSLTTLAQPFREIGHHLVEMLVKEISGNQKKSHLILEPKLIVRESTAPIKEVSKE